VSELLTTRAVASLLKVSPETVLRWHRSGKLPGGRRLSSNLLRFDSDEVARWLEGRRESGNEYSGLVGIREEA
jgi:excisionase family DNA binding protein